MKEIVFEGKPSGDHECFCWDVDLKTYEHITGEKPDKYDRMIDFVRGGKVDGMYRIYPEAVLIAAGIDRSDLRKKYRFKISVEGIKET